MFFIFLLLFTKRLVEKAKKRIIRWIRILKNYYLNPYELELVRKKYWVDNS